MAELEQAEPAPIGQNIRGVHLGILGAVAAAVVTAGGLMWYQQGAALEQARAELAVMQTQSQQAQAKLHQVEDEALEDAVGLNPHRAQRDTEEVELLAQTAFTFDSGQSYDQARQEVLDRFDRLDAKDEFFTKTMPPAAYNTDVHGQRYYQLDALGLRSTVGAVQLHPVDVRADRVRYLVEVDVNVESQSVRVRDVKNATLLEVTTDADSRVLDLKASPGAGLQRSAG